MKSTIKPQNHRPLQRACLAFVLAATACGNAPQEESSPNEPLAVVRNLGPIPANGYCGAISLGVDEEGRELVEGEQYSVDLMNENLANDAALRVFTGLESVSTCEDARAYSDGYAKYRAAVEPNELSGGIPADMPVLRADEIVEPKVENAGDEVSKILNGTIATKTEAVQLLYYMDEQIRANDKEVYKKWSSCTAVRIAGPLFLTAAHCLIPYFVPKQFMGPSTLFEEMYALNTIEIRYKTSAQIGIRYYRGSCNKTNTDCNILSAKAYIHPKYTGAATDTDSDLAVIYVLPASQTSLRADADGWTNRYSWIAPQLPVKGQALAVYGWGPVSNTDTKQSAYQERVVPGTTMPISTDIYTMAGKRTLPEGGKKVEKEYRYGTFGVTTTDTKQFCKGDSGSPGYVDPNRVQGIMHGMTTPFAQLCVGSGKEVDLARADLVQDWINAAVRKLQSGETQPPIANACSCAFVGATTDPYNSENPAARITCANGCTDPNLLQR